jgi:CRP-like cAMP-binding protein
MNQDNLIQFFSNEFPFNTDGLAQFVQSFERITYKKDTLLLEIGEPERFLRFLDEGIVREYYAHDGKEKNIDFFVQAEFITDFNAFVTEKPSRKYQECLTNVSVRILSKEKFMSFLAQYSCGKLFIDEIFQRIIAKKEKQEFQQFLNTAEENYLELLRHKSAWLQKIPQYHIASYLGITAETLSRIRKRIHF